MISIVCFKPITYFFQLKSFCPMKIPILLQKKIEKLIPKKEQQTFLEEVIEEALKKKMPSKIEENIEIYTDGGSRGNPGPSGGGFAIYKGGKLVLKGSEYFGQKTNNQAEYLALRLALREAYEKFKEAKIQCFLDSKLAVEQMNGNFKVKSENVRPLFEEVRRIADQFKAFSIYHIPREQNKVADRLANEAMDKK